MVERRRARWSKEGVRDDGASAFVMIRIGLRFRHCEERSDAAIHTGPGKRHERLDCHHGATDI